LVSRRGENGPAAVQNSFCPFFAALVGAKYAREAVPGQEFVQNVLSKELAATSRRFGESFDRTVRVAPKQVAGGGIPDVAQGFAHYFWEVAEISNPARDTAMYTEDTAVHNGSVRQMGEGIAKLIIDRVIPKKFVAFYLESVLARNHPVLVVATEEIYMVGIENPQGVKKQDRFDGLVATVDVIAKEEIGACWGIAESREDENEIGKMAVKVADENKRT
jgi:hypothetical protein